MTDEEFAKLKELLRGFLDTDALARKAMGKHLDGRTPAQVKDFTAIVSVGRRLPSDVFIEDSALLYYFRNAERLAQ